MSITNNERFMAGPQCLLTMPLQINDNENAEFRTGAGTAVAGGKTAGGKFAPKTQEALTFSFAMAAPPFT